jgi:fatty acid synthase
MQTIQPSGPYRLCGYSFGACVAMEMAAQVEQHGEVVSELLLLDGSHAYVAAHTHQHTKRMAGDTCQAETEALCAFMLALGTPLDYVKVASEMREAASWDDRVTLAVQRVLAVNKAWSADELKVAAVTFYRKLVMADAYKLTHKLACSTVTLVKAGQSTAQYSVLGADYGLAEVRGMADN